MESQQQEVLDIFKNTKALLTGHFVLRSGLHSGHYFPVSYTHLTLPTTERV